MEVSERGASELLTCQTQRDGRGQKSASHLGVENRCNPESGGRQSDFRSNDTENVALRRATLIKSDSPKNSALCSRPKSSSSLETYDCPTFYCIFMRAGCFYGLMVRRRSFANSQNPTERPITTIEVIKAEIMENNCCSGIFCRPEHRLGHCERFILSISRVLLSS